MKLKSIIFVALVPLFVEAVCENPEGMQEKLECLINITNGVIEKNNILENKINNTFPIATVIHSLLNEKEFQLKMGKEWVLMDGRKVSKTDEIFKYFPNGKLPDARGKFLRMLNNGLKTNSSDQEINRKIGSYQKDNYEKHKHFIGTSNGKYGVLLVPVNLSGVVNNVYTNYRYNSGNAKVRPTDKDSVKALKTDGGKETTVKNIAINYFIKIRKTK